MDELCFPPMRGTGSHVDATACDPIDIENVGEDVYILRARGHHDVHKFMRQVRDDGYEWPLGMPVHTWARTLPSQYSGYSCRYVLCDRPGRGAYPVTYVQEAWGVDSYEAIVATESALNVPRVRGKHESEP